MKMIVMLVLLAGCIGQDDVAQWPKGEQEGARIYQEMLTYVDTVTVGSYWSPPYLQARENEVKIDRLEQTPEYTKYCFRGRYITVDTRTKKVVAIWKER